MSSHGKKMLAPVIITIVFLLYLLIYVVMLAQVVMAEPLALILAIPLVLLGVGDGKRCTGYRGRPEDTRGWRTDKIQRNDE